MKMPSAIQCSLMVLITCFLLTSCEVRHKPEIPVKEESIQKTAEPTAPAPQPVSEVAATSITTHFVIGEPKYTYPLRKDIPASQRLGQPALRVERHNDSMELIIPLRTGEAIWGFGQRLDAFNLRGKRLETWTTDGWNALDTSYYAVPFFISSEGYGLFINCTGKLTCDIGRNNPNELRISVPDSGADLYVFDGPPAEVSQAYTELVGHPRAIPEWIFRPWVSRNSYLGSLEVDRVVERMQKYGMPVGVVVLEAWEEQLHNFKFTEHRYPDPKAWIQKLRDQDVHVVCWLTSSVLEGTLAYEQAKEKGYLVLNDNGSEHIVRWLENGRKIDFRKPGAFEWWRDLHKPLVKMGVDGFKTDGGEHMPDPYFHNQHTYYYQKAALDAFEGSGRNGITFARSASPLNAGLGTFWAGDQQAEWSRLKAVIKGGISAAVSGFPLWASDIGAYTGDPSKELYIRWLQFGSMSPLMQFHGVSAREPWHFDRETVEICRFYFQMRERLLPKIIQWSSEINNGTPIMRPLVWEFPDDAKTHDIDSQYMFGPDLLVAPVTDPLEVRGVYLPEGNWIDLWSGDKHTGPKQFLHHASLAQLPVFVREEKFSEYKDLFDGAPVIETNHITVALAGDTNSNGLVPVLRYWKSGDRSERFYYEIKNGTEKAATIRAQLDVPDGFAAKPGAPFQVRVPAGGVQRLAFTVEKTGALPPLTHPVRLTATMNGETLETPAAGIVVSPEWHVAGLFEGGVGSFQSLDGLPVDLNEKFSGQYARKFGWSKVPEDAVSSDGKVNLEAITGSDGWSSLFVSTEITLRRSRSLKFLTGFGDTMTMWINGKQVQNITGHRNPLRDEDSLQVQLSTGTHSILIRNSRDLASPYFFFRIVD